MPGCSVNCTNPDSIGAGAYQEFIFRSDSVNFGAYTPPPAGWIFSWSLCYRNATIDNIANPGTLSSNFRSVMYSYNGQPASPYFDSSPAFAERPQAVFCSPVGNSIIYSAFDSDNDSVLHSWANPADGQGTIVTLNFSNGYSLTNQFPGSPQLNPVTGMITINSSQQGDYVSCVKAESYKCNVLVAEVFRDFQIQFSNAECGVIAGGTVNNNPAFIADSMHVNSVYDTVYAGDLVEFNFQVSDPDLALNMNYQSVTVDAEGIQLGDNGVDSMNGCAVAPCATLNEVVPHSFIVGYDYSFQWQTRCEHLQGSCYSTHFFAFHASDDACNIRGGNHLVYAVTIKGVETHASGNLIFTDFPNGSLQWYYNAIAGATDSFLVMQDSGIYMVAATLDGGCTLNSEPYYHLVTQITDISTDPVRLFPNPASSTIYISGLQHSGRFQLVLYDFTGRAVLKSDNELTVPVKELKAGTYFYEVNIGIFGASRGSVIIE